ncbi:MAG: VWA domain-containing protein [Acidobacteria bacterium]|nr:VWA domain-containing protein [Acidobacteriota bacterium]
MIDSKGQESRVPLRYDAAQSTSTEEDFKIRIGVEEVRIDAVVVDGKGRQITDLMADDFEIYQDGQPQKVTSSTYIVERQTSPDKKTVRAQEPEKPPQIPARALTKGVVRRTIVFLVDDLSMSFQDLHNARMSLQKFVETQMYPGDLVAIMQTGKGNAGLQAFSSDKRELLARIGSIRWSMNLQSGGIQQIASLAYGIKALRDVPGRKFLFLLSAQIMLPEKEDSDALFNRLADEALRAGVVIHTLDILGGINSQTITGLDKDKAVKERTLDAETRPHRYSISPTAEDNMPRSPGEIAQLENEAKLDQIFGPRQSEVRRLQAQERMVNRESPLSQKTGGIFLTGNNFFIDGIGIAEEEMKGYYLLSYVPAANTFTSGSSSAAYHKVTIKVKRPGSVVHTRDGFYGNPGASMEAAKDRNPLEDALFSPFRYSDLKLSLASGYINDPQKGYLLRAWLHLDGQRLGFVNEKDGGHSISLEAVAATSDIHSIIQDSGSTRIGFRVNSKDIQWIRENGIRFSLSLPAQKAGAYYVRVAVKDQSSGAIGSAYQFIEIPDLKRDGLSLSSIFILNRDDDAAWIQSGAAEEPRGQPNRSRQIARRSQALRSYMPGEGFEYLTIVYGAETKSGLPPDLEYQFALYGNGKEILKSKPEAVDIRGAKDPARILIRKRLKLKNGMQPGDYVLQLRVMDKRSHERNLATQTLDFEIAEKLSGTSAAHALSQLEVSAMPRSVIEMTAEELRRYDLALADLNFSQSQTELSFLLEKVGNRVVAFFRDFPNTSSKELVCMQRYLAESQGDGRKKRQSQPALLDAPGKGAIAVPLSDPRIGFICDQLGCDKPGNEPMCAQLGCSQMDTQAIPKAGSRTILLKEYSAEFNYFILPGSRNSRTSWIEDRTDKEGRPANPKDISEFIMSSGHTLLCQYLHPRHQANSIFRYLGREKKKPHAHIIAFAQKPESNDYLAQYFDATDDASAEPVRFLVQGFIWVDPEKHQISRMRTRMLVPERQTTLKETITDILYGRVLFGDMQQEFWLPREINVSWEFPNNDKLDLIFRNQHRYSDHHLFTVDSRYEITLPKANK